MSQVLAGFTVESTDDEIKSMPLKSPLRIKFEKEIAKKDLVFRSKQHVWEITNKISIINSGPKP